mmetsp:Transcript_14036/g.21256  ORF Transcript_14036/g.21256 Transcript_14036/m.21256 type:complete len:550 (+) Transcript_14036:89-1738(+)
MDPYFKKCYYCKQNKIETVTDDVKGSWMQCSECEKVVEERQPKLKHTTFSKYRISTLEIAASSEASSTGEKPVDGKKKALDGFVTSYCQMDSELYSLDLCFSRSVAGNIIELQYLIGDELLGDRKHEQYNDKIMIGYVTISELCTTFGTPLKLAPAVSLFKKCVGSTVYEQVTNIEDLGIAAFAVHACEEWKDISAKAESGGRPADIPSSSAPSSPGNTVRVYDSPRAEIPARPEYPTLPQVDRKRPLSQTRGTIPWELVLEESKRKSTRTINETEIRKHIGMISNVVNNEPVVVEALRLSMSKYFKELKLEKNTQKLAAHIGNQAVKKHLCYRRNSSSLSAAAVYLAMQLQGTRTTQNSFCKAVGLTEVTLRKVYKELKTHWKKLVPDSYKPFNIPNGLKLHTMRQERSGADLAAIKRAGKVAPPPPPPPRPSLKKSNNKSKSLETGYSMSKGGYPHPDQYTLDGKSFWKREGKKWAAKSNKPFPKPEEVYADIPSEENLIIVKRERGENVKPSFNISQTYNTVRKLVPPTENVFQPLNSYGENIKPC